MGREMLRGDAQVGHIHSSSSFSADLGMRPPEHPQLESAGLLWTCPSMHHPPMPNLDLQCRSHSAVACTCCHPHDLSPGEPKSSQGEAPLEQLLYLTPYLPYLPLSGLVCASGEREGRAGSAGDTEPGLGL